MANLIHMGCDAWVIHRLPHGRGRASGDAYAAYSDFESDPFEKEVKGYNKKHLIAFACSYQTGASATFKKLGFKKVIEFNSAHGAFKDKDEIITVWYKYNSKAPKSDDSRAMGHPLNCSISTKTKPHRCNLFLRKKGEAAPKDFKRIESSPIYFKLNDISVWGEKRSAPYNQMYR